MSAILAVTHISANSEGLAICDIIAELERGYGGFERTNIVAIVRTGSGVEFVTNEIPLDGVEDEIERAEEQLKELQASLRRMKNAL